MYGKDPPKDTLAKSERLVRNAQLQIEKLQDGFENKQTKWNVEKSVMVTKRQALEDEHRHNSRELKEKIRHYKKDIASSQKEIIKEKVDDALLKSRNVIEGHIAELFPIFHKTRINPADLCALIPTSPLDYISFNGLFQKNVTRITFLDVKKGNAHLNPTQKSIKAAVEDGHVDFKTIKVNFDKIKGNARET